VPSAGCHRAVSAAVADAVNYILQGVLTTGTAAGMELSGRQAAGKTGTSNVISGNGTPYAAFAGYTPTLAGYVSVFYPQAPEAAAHVMGGSNACYRLESGGLSCPGEMFGANAPASTWHMTFDHANLGSAADFVPVPVSSAFNSQGNGQTVVQQKSPGKGGKGGKGGNGGPGNGGGGNGGPGNGGGPGTNAAYRTGGKVRVAARSAAAPAARGVFSAPGNAPARNVPARNVPARSVPVRNVPARNVPARNVPAANAPADNAPADNAPAGNAPAVAPAGDVPTG